MFFNQVDETHNAKLQETIEQLNDEQLRALRHIENPCLVVASAGSGKTKLLTTRVADLIGNHSIDPQNILVVTFTNQATDNMIKRLDTLIGRIQVSSLNIGTFHSICLRMIKEQGVIDVDNQIMSTWKMEEIINSAKETYLCDVPTDEIINWISNQKNDLLTSDDLIKDKEKMAHWSDFVRIYNYYEVKKREMKLYDFGDMILVCYKMLKNNKEIREYYQNKFKHICVDEAQDSSKGLYTIIKILSEKYSNVFFVGDTRQSIYSFANAKVEYILNFEKEWENASVYFLNYNYRSTKHLVNLGNRLANFNEHKLMKGTTISKREDGLPPVFKCCSDEYSEAEYVRVEIEKLIQKGYNYKDIAIIFRTNSQSCPIETTFGRYDIPYVTLNTNSFFDRVEIRHILSYFQLAQNPKNNVAFSIVYNTPNRFLSNEFLNKLTEHCKEKKISLYEGLDGAKFLKEKPHWEKTAKQLKSFISMLQVSFYHNKDNPSDLIDSIIKSTKYKEYLRGKSFGKEDNVESKIENLNALVKLAEKYNTCNSFIKYCNKVLFMNNNASKKDEDKVKLITAHKSKGLEFKVTFCVGMSNGLLPHIRAIEEGNIAEERRVCYVDITRAEDVLYITFPLRYGKKERMASPFLEEMIGSDNIEKLMKYKFTYGEVDFKKELEEKKQKDKLLEEFEQKQKANISRGW